ncbi:hypothetical protein MML48_3g00008357 [Holotrichia oblita]|uniref:Uncharacterized protein n=1 Tax=Holotrichia oblita TaxID=644536 RepID=A0ACB9TEX9_HOLOL|nr:hypothetical protein MML48_3g00008357 [Holotrichia oblita]
MEPFRLEPPDKQNERTQYRMLHAKKTYALPVKIVDWHKKTESRPIDVDPYCKGKINYFLSHYDSLGIAKTVPYITTTMDMLNQINAPDKYRGTKYRKPFINYTSYKDWLPCEVKNEACPPRCVNNYLSTMQYFFTPPYPYRVERLSCPIIPYLQNQKLGCADPNLSKYKFYDEDFPEITHLLHKHKSYRWKSYNPCTGIYSDGTPVPEDKKSCYNLHFANENIQKKYLLKKVKCTYKIPTNKTN